MAIAVTEPSNRDDRLGNSGVRPASIDEYMAFMAIQRPASASFRRVRPLDNCSFRASSDSQRLATNEDAPSESVKIRLIRTKHTMGMVGRERRTPVHIT